MRLSGQQVLSVDAAAPQCGPMLPCYQRSPHPAPPTCPSWAPAVPAPSCSTPLPGSAGQDEGARSLLCQGPGADGQLPQVCSRGAHITAYPQVGTIRGPGVLQRAQVGVPAGKEPKRTGNKAPGRPHWAWAGAGGGPAALLTPCPPQHHPQQVHLHLPLLWCPQPGPAGTAAPLCGQPPK